MNAQILAPPFDETAVEGDRLKALLAYWRSKLRDGRLPARAQLDPAEMKTLLPFVYLIGVEEEPRRFRYRLIGTQIVRWSGGDATGRHADDPFCGEGRFALIELYQTVTRAGAPVLTPWQPAVLGGSPMLFSRLLLPLSSDGARIDMILGGAEERAA